MPATFNIDYSGHFWKKYMYSAVGHVNQIFYCKNTLSVGTPM